MYSYMALSGKRTRISFNEVFFYDPMLGPGDNHEYVKSPYYPPFWLILLARPIYPSHLKGKENMGFAQNENQPESYK